MQPWGYMGVAQSLRCLFCVQYIECRCFKQFLTHFNPSHLRFHDGCNCIPWFVHCSANILKDDVLDAKRPNIYFNLPDLLMGRVILFYTTCQVLWPVNSIPRPTTTKTFYVKILKSTLQPIVSLHILEIQKLTTHNGKTQLSTFFSAPEGWAWSIQVSKFKGSLLFRSSPAATSAALDGWALRPWGWFRQWEATANRRLRHGRCLTKPILIASFLELLKLQGVGFYRVDGFAFASAPICMV